MKNEKKKTTPKMRNEFIARTYAIVLECIGEQTDAVPSKVEIRLTLTNNNRYVRLHKYGEDMALLIYRDGKVALELSEACHDKHKEQLSITQQTQTVQIYSSQNWKICFLV